MITRFDTQWNLSRVRWEYTNLCMFPCGEKTLFTANVPFAWTFFYRSLLENVPIFNGQGFNISSEGLIILQTLAYKVLKSSKVSKVLKSIVGDFPE